MTFGIFLLVAYIISVIVCGVLHWAEYIDRKRIGYVPAVKEKVIYLYLLPLTPILNIFAIFYSVSSYCN